jgi:hypothetical protein
MSTKDYAHLLPQHRWPQGTKAIQTASSSQTMHAACTSSRDGFVAVADDAPSAATIPSSRKPRGGAVGVGVGVNVDVDVNVHVDGGGNGNADAAADVDVNGADDAADVDVIGVRDSKADVNTCLATDVIIRLVGE